MDINKTIIVISIIVVFLCCLVWAIKEPFISGMALTNNDFNQGISNSTEGNQLPLYFKEITLDDMNTLLQKTIDRQLQRKLKNRIGTPSSLNSQDIKKLASSYVANSINSLPELQSTKAFEVIEARIESIQTVDMYDICIIFITVHREAKRIGFSLKAEVAINSSLLQISGIVDIRALGYISEDILLMTQGYDKQVKQGDALSIDHTIIKNSVYEDSVIKEQASGLFKDRGIRRLTNMT
jgi:hypothetical protein